MDQLHKNRFQVAKHRPGLNIKAELLFKIAAEGDLESKRDVKRQCCYQWKDKRVYKCCAHPTHSCTNTHICSHIFPLSPRLQRSHIISVQVELKDPAEKPSSVTKTISPRPQNRSRAKIEFFQTSKERKSWNFISQLWPFTKHKLGPWEPFVTRASLIRATPYCFLMGT